MISLADKKILVTGATSGIGLASSVKISELSGTLYAIGKSDEKIQKLQSTLGPKHFVFQQDLARFEEYQKLVTSLPSLDGLVFSAGLNKLVPFKMLSKKLLDELFEINTFSPILLLKEILVQKKLNVGASVIFLSTTATEFTDKAQIAYAASKAPLLSLAKGLTMEFSKNSKHRFNNLQLGAVDTPMNKNISDIIGEANFEKMISTQQLGLGKSSNIAELICFLLSDSSTWVTGSNIKVDGGSIGL